MSYRKLYIKEIQDRKNRERNFIVFNAPEHDTNLTDIRVCGCVRTWRWWEGCATKPVAWTLMWQTWETKEGDEKPGSIKVEMKDSDTKEGLFKRLWKLGEAEDKYKQLSIQRDWTKKGRKKPVQKKQHRRGILPSWRTYVVSYLFDIRRGVLPFWRTTWHPTFLTYDIASYLFDVRRSILPFWRTTWPPICLTYDVASYLFDVRRGVLLAKHLIADGAASRPLDGGGRDERRGGRDLVLNVIGRRRRRCSRRLLLQPQCTSYNLACLCMPRCIGKQSRLKRKQKFQKILPNFWVKNLDQQFWANLFTKYFYQFFLPKMVDGQ